MNIEFFISITSGTISAALVLGLIFSSRFRRDVLGGQGEATVLGFVTAKGAAIIVLCALFVGGMLYPLFRSNPDCARSVGSLKAQLDEKFHSQVEGAARDQDTAKLEGIVTRLMQSAEKIEKSCR